MLELVLQTVTLLVLILALALEITEAGRKKRRLAITAMSLAAIGAGLGAKSKFDEERTRREVAVLYDNDSQARQQDAEDTHSQLWEVLHASNEIPERLKPMLEIVATFIVTKEKENLRQATKTLNEKFDEKLSTSNTAMTKKLDEKFDEKLSASNTAMTKKLDEKLDEKFSASNTAMTKKLDEKLDEKLSASNTAMTKKLDEKLSASSTEMTNKLDEKLSAQQKTLESVQAKLAELELGVATARKQAPAAPAGTVPSAGEEKTDDVAKASSQHAVATVEGAQPTTK